MGYVLPADGFFGTAGDTEDVADNMISCCHFLSFGFSLSDIDAV